MLRTEEMLSAEWQRITVSSYDLATIALPFTKSDWIRRAQEVTTIYDPMIGRTLKKAVAPYRRST